MRTDCIPWKGACTGNGYGASRLNGKQRGAHVVAAIAAGMRVEPGQVVMHSCDNPLCVNPAHLRVGTTAENMADKVAKGRQAKGARNGRAKLSAEQVAAIRASKAPGVTNRELGRRFGVTAEMIGYILRGKNWL